MEMKLINEDQIIARIDKRILQAKNTKTLMKNISVDMRNKTVTRFQHEKDQNGKKWASNSAATIKKKRSSKVGTDTGRLKNSIKGKNTLIEAMATTNVEYGKYFNYGVKRKNIPTRNFMGFSGNQKKLYKKWIKDFLSK